MVLMLYLYGVLVFLEYMVFDTLTSMPLLSLMKPEYVLLVAVFAYLLFLVAFHKLITVSYANWLCETYLNPRIEGARTNIGLRPENWDDVEFRPEDDEE